MINEKRSLETKEKGNNSFNFFPFPTIYRDYSVYLIVREGNLKTFGYLGVFNTGRFNYVIAKHADDKFNSSLVLAIENFIRELGLCPELNPQFQKYYS